MTATAITPPRGTRWREVEHDGMLHRWTGRLEGRVNDEWTPVVLIRPGAAPMVSDLIANPTEPIPAPVVDRDAQWENVRDLVGDAFQSGNFETERRDEITDRIVALLRGEEASADQYDRLKKWQKWADAAASGHHDAPMASTDEEVRAVIDKKLNEHTTAAQCLARLQELGWVERVVRLPFNGTGRFHADENDVHTRTMASHAPVEKVHRALVAPTPETV